MVEEHDEFLYSLKGKKKGGHLDKWCRCSINKGQIIGIVSGNIKYRDGKIIRCSTTVAIHEVGGKKILETANSFYYLGEQGTAEDLHNHHMAFYGAVDWIKANSL